MRTKSRTKSVPTMMLHGLEIRVMLSAAIFSPHLSTATGEHPAITVHAHTLGETLHLTAAVPFSGEVAFFVPATTSVAPQFSASIDWGDGSTSSGTITAATRGHFSGYEVTGIHTYANAGKFKIVSTIAQGVVGSPATPLLFVARVVSRAVVAQNNSAPTGTGVTLNEVAGTAFTESVGAFQIIAPGGKLKATITWGDGTESDGTITPAGVIGIDVLSYEVTGMHMYAAAGNYAIHTTITGRGVSTAARTVATIDSTASVVAPKTIALAGTLTGSYTTPVIAIPDVGQTYSITGSGTAGVLGTVTANGSVSTPGFILWSGPAEPLR